MNLFLKELYHYFSNLIFNSFVSTNFLILFSIEDGNLFSWGYGYYGQLGHGNNSNLSVPTKISTLSNVVSIACSMHHSMAIKYINTI